jgi:hypothetical protein
MYADRPLIREKRKIYEHGGQLNLKFTFCFMDITHQLFHLDEVWFNEGACLQALFQSRFSLAGLLNMTNVGFSDF